eukprot:scaffold3222_cov116-Isochrysis_galbana.AAC.1
MRPPSRPSKTDHSKWETSTSNSWSAPLLYLHECRQAIHRLGLAKAAGPDGLPAEFYKSFEDLVVRDLHNTLVEAHAEGALPPTIMREGRRYSSPLQERGLKGPPKL